MRHAILSLVLLLLAAAAPAAADVTFDKRTISERFIAEGCDVADFNQDGHSDITAGNLIFYGPEGSQHVTLYLGDGQMMEASSAAGQVTVSPVRTAGMTPYLTRIIET